MTISSMHYYPEDALEVKPRVQPGFAVPPKWRENEGQTWSSEDTRAFNFKVSFALLTAIVLDLTRSPTAT